MGKSKSNNLAKLPKEQRCKFLIGPNSSWYVPNISDIWTQPPGKRTKLDDESNNKLSNNNDIMDCDLQPTTVEERHDNLSYFLYGSIGCFCYGEIYHHKHLDKNPTNQLHFKTQNVEEDSVSAFVTRLVDVKEDHSRVSCVRFLKTSMFPIAIVLTENGSLIIHDCLTSTNLIHFKKSELMNKFVEPLLEKTNDDTDGDEQQCNKRARFNHTQQVNSCSWPDSTNIFIAFSLVKQKTNLLFWLKVKDVTKMRDNPQSICKTDFIESHQQLELKSDQYPSPICCMTSALTDPQTCIVAIAMDDGLITVVNINFEKGQAKRVIKLARHNEQICSLSLYTGNCKKFPKGLLASASRSGLVLIWDIENEFYFADYQATSFGGKAGPRINWFCLSFLEIEGVKQVNLAISNCESGLTIFELPENTRSKIRLKENKDRSKKQHGYEQSIQHRALLFNAAFDPITNIIMTTSLDGNHIVWKCKKQLNLPISNKTSSKEHSSVDIVPQYLLPSMPNNSKTHMIRHNPIREDLLGIAIGNAGVKFYRVTENLMNCRFDMNSSCNSIARGLTKAKLSLTSLSWHPNHEYRVAIGTLDGKVFRADITPRKGTLIEAQQRKVAKSKLNADKLNQKSMTSTSEGLDVFDVEYQPLDRNDDVDADCNLSNADLSESSNQHKNDGIYSLCWGPNPACPQDITKLAIYAISCAKHKLSIYYSKKENPDKLTNYLDEFLDQSLPEAIGEASEVAWKGSMDLMALGTTSGKIIIVSYLNNSSDSGDGGVGSVDKLFKKLAVIQGPLGATYIQCLAWHSTTDRDDPNYYYIAASANESAAFVFDIRESILAADVRDSLRIVGENRDDFGGDKMFSDANISETTTSVNILSTFRYKLEAHTKAVTDIIWNPHNPNELATSSFDRCAYVWSLTNSPGQSARIISKFSARDRLFTLEWSLVDKDLIFTSGNDSTIWAWRPSENLTSRVNDISKSDVA